ncbi:MAG: peptidase [Panacagrimonas sp.]|nr:DegQ family serine endoprotease [Panacagrimonas sp.]MCC2657011.1 peptidase [Panacagrimonas sp.]
MTVTRFVRKPIVAAALGAMLAAPMTLVLAEHPQSAAVTGSPSEPPVAAATMALPDFAALVRQYGPAVVNITVKENVKTSARGNAMPPGFRGFPPGYGGGDADPFAPFFRGMPPGGGSPGPTRGQGSGFIVKSDGLILTNAHVVADASEVTVKLTDRREFTAKVVGVDPTSDVAVLRIEAKGLPTVRIGDPSRVAVGEWVVAIGAPFGFENSVTQGIVSAKGRTLPDGSYVPFLQTDVAINPGNSGGPLFNLAGEVVGINSQIYSRSGGYQGVSFAIPIDVAMNVGDQLQATGHVARGRLGVTVQPVDAALAKSFGLKSPQGALVSDIDDDGPADKAGLESGDVILGLDGQPVDESSQLPARVASLKPGQKSTLSVWRDGKTRELSVQVGEMRADEVADAGDAKAAPQGRLGLAVRPLSRDEQRQIDAEGLLVEDVAGNAADAGIQPGDIVISANGHAVNDIEQLRKAIDKASGSVALLIQREGHRLFVPVNVG